MFPISITYSNENLRILVEKYITQQKSVFTLQGVCSYVLYWAIEEGVATPSADGLFAGDKICPADRERISAVLEKIVRERRIAADGEQYRISLC